MSILATPIHQPNYLGSNTFDQHHEAVPTIDDIHSNYSGPKLDAFSTQTQDVTNDLQGFDQQPYYSGFAHLDSFPPYSQHSGFPRTLHYTPLFPNNESNLMDFGDVHEPEDEGEGDSEYREG
jgi:hypothetical protein